MQLALATGASLSAVCAMAQEGGDAAITQLYNAQNLRDSYAYIVVGSGSGGATVAGRRVNIPQSYLYPVLKQGNVTLLTVAEATTLIMEGTTCKGVNFVKGGETKSARAPRVILSAGAINTPKMLVLSGIGPKAELDRIGVPVTVDLPGVGQNFQDHVLLAGCIWEYNEPLPPRNSLAGATFFWKSDSALDSPDMQPFQIEVPYATEVTGPSYAPPCRGMDPVARPCPPKSRGRVYLTSNDPMAQAREDAQFLSHPDDLTAVVRCIELCREIGNSGAMREFVKREVMPGAFSPAEMQDFAKNAAGTCFHESCTCKMGTDEMSLVDANLSVYGVEGLSIADASIMPRVTTGNTMAPTVIIGERAADILLA